MITAEIIKQQLSCGEPGCSCNKSYGNVHCPAHQDENPSLSVSAKNGKLLVKCHAGCSQDVVIRALKERNLWPSKNGDGFNKRSKKSLTLQEFSVAKRLPIEFLRKHGVSEFKGNDGYVEVRFHYLDQNKTLISTRRRVAMTGKNKFKWIKGDKVLLYGLWELGSIRDAGWCLIVEGESDFLTARFHKIPALAIPGKGTWKSEWAKHIAGLRIYLWQEPDAPELPGKMMKDIPALLVIKAPSGIKDISEAHLQGQDVRALIEKLKSEASPPEITPQILVNRRFLHDVSNEAIKALEIANHPPFLFRRLGTLVRISLDEKDAPKIIALNDVQLRGILARHAHFLKATEKGQTPTFPPVEVVKDILSLGEWKFPPLGGIIQSPALRLDGTVFNAPGYDPQTRLFYVKPPDLFVPTIPENPTREEIQRAVYLIGEIIVDFPFVEESDRANTLGLLMTLPLRPSIKGNIPKAAITAPAPGTGKSLLTDIVAQLGTGKVAAMAGIPKDDDEMRKAITSRLLAGDLLISFDNLEMPLWGPSLSRALTCTIWEDRILGKSATVRLPQRAVWIANGNNLKLRGDLPRRTFPIRLDTKLAKPWERENFKHKNLMEWILSRRGDFLVAILTIARAWFMAGQPEPEKPLPVIGGFDAWARIIGGVLAFAGIKGFLENLNQFHGEADLEGLEWKVFLESWVETIGYESKTCQEVAAILRNHPKFAATLPDILQDVLKDSEKSFERSLGRALARKENRPYGENNLALQRDGINRDKVTFWKVTPL